MYLNTELKMNGKNAFRRNYWPCVGATLVVSLLTGGGASAVGNASDVSDLATNTFSGSTSVTDHIMSIPTGMDSLKRNIKADRLAKSIMKSLQACFCIVAFCYSNEVGNYADGRF